MENGLISISISNKLIKFNQERHSKRAQVKKKLAVVLAVKRK